MSSSEEVVYRTVSTSHSIFHNRETQVYGAAPTGGMIPMSTYPIPDDVVLCNGCNQNMHPGTIDLVYIQGGLYDAYCLECRVRYFPQAREYAPPELPVTRCPSCEHLLETSTPVAGVNQMQVHDLSVCAYCGAFLEWLGDGYRNLPEGVWEALPEGQRVIMLRIQQAVRA